MPRTEDGIAALQTRFSEKLRVQDGVLTGSMATLITVYTALIKLLLRSSRILAQIASAERRYDLDRTWLIQSFRRERHQSGLR